MTRDCRHSTGDDQRLWTVQEMTADLWGGGERIPEFDSPAPTLQKPGRQRAAG
ncbi:unnamed protein product [Staurois parvus]|uniref:Uncharacterized protein n=1 Tax=Staurois parvus TaxID=386267 RepID=A0ABN9BJC6_9NEOB|nr:unnamed protein product [Staurois parvus]